MCMQISSAVELFCPTWKSIRQSRHRKNAHEQLNRGRASEPTDIVALMGQPDEPAEDPPAEAPPLEDPPDKEPPVKEPDEPAPMKSA